MNLELTTRVVTVLLAAAFLFGLALGYIGRGFITKQSADLIDVLRFITGTSVVTTWTTLTIYAGFNKDYQPSWWLNFLFCGLLGVMFKINFSSLASAIISAAGKQAGTSGFPTSGESESKHDNNPTRDE